MPRNKIKNMVYISLGAVLMSVCSIITVPFAVPFTMQTFGVFMVLLLLGGKKGSASILLYILLGVFGIPVFSGFGSGFGYLLGPTGGFIIGFAFSGAVYLALELFLGKNGKLRILGLASSLLTCYAFGTGWYMVYCSMNGVEMGLIYALSICVFPYMLPDVLKLCFSCILYKRLEKHIKI